MRPVPHGLTPFRSTGNANGLAATDSGNFLSSKVSKIAGSRQGGVVKNNLAVRELINRNITLPDRMPDDSAGRGDDCRNRRNRRNLGDFSWLPDEMICEIVLYLPMDAFRALLSASMAFHCSVVSGLRETYLKRAFHNIYLSYFGDLEEDSPQLEKCRQHFTLHEDEAINRLRQVIPTQDFAVAEVMLRQKSLYLAGLLRMLSNTGGLTYQTRMINTGGGLVGSIANLPGINRIVSLSGKLDVFDTSRPTGQEKIPDVDIPGPFLRDNVAIFPDGKIACSVSGGDINIFDVSQDSGQTLIRSIKPDKPVPNTHCSLQAASKDILVAEYLCGSVWLFDLRRPVGHELFRKLRQNEQFVETAFCGCLPGGELITTDYFTGIVNIWRPNRRGLPTLQRQGQECLKSLMVWAGVGCQAMPLDSAGKIAVWPANQSEYGPIKIFDVYQPPGSELMGSLHVRAHYYTANPLLLGSGQLLVIFTDLRGGFMMGVWNLCNSEPELVKLEPLSVPGNPETLQRLPDGRVLAIAYDHMYIIDLTKPEHQKVTVRIPIDKNIPRVLRPLATLVSGELAAVASLGGGNNIHLVDYYSVRR